VSRHHLSKKRRHPAGHIGREVGEGSRILLENRAKEFLRGFPIEGTSTGEDMKKRAPQAINVGALVQRTVSKLLGGEVAQGGDRALLPRLVGPPDVGSDPQLTNLQSLVPGQEQVLRGDFPVDDLSLFRVKEGGRRVSQHLKGLRARNTAAPLEQLSQAPSWKVLHAVEEEASFLGHIVDMDDVRVIQ